jgi:cephalosporin-C deacetylase
MVQDAMIAVRLLQAQVEVHEDRVAAMGMSQGAGIAIWLAAWCPIVKAVCADMPFLSDIRHTLSTQVHRYPLKELTDFMDSIPLGEPQLHNTLGYFDTANHAAFCKVPAQVSLGLKDPACRPDTVRKLFDQIPTEKQLLVYDWGHDWHPDMVEANRKWLMQHLNH